MRLPVSFAPAAEQVLAAHPEPRLRDWLVEVLALDPRPDAVLIDGKPVKKYPLHQVALVKGDSLSFSIAAASVIAKVTRDRIMLKMAETYPQYGFEIHKGYPTPKHLAALKQHGPCPQHRRSFAPVAQLELDLG